VNTPLTAPHRPARRTLARTCVPVTLSYKRGLGNPKSAKTLFVSMRIVSRPFRRLTRRGTRRAKLAPSTAADLGVERGWMIAFLPGRTRHASRPCPMSVMFPAPSGERETVLRYDASSCAGYGLADVARHVRGMPFYAGDDSSQRVDLRPAWPSRVVRSAVRALTVEKYMRSVQSPQVQYRSRESQASHWSQHKGECRVPFVPPPLPEALAGRASLIFVPFSLVPSNTMHTPHN